MLKRFIDIIIAIVGLILFFPLLLFIFFLLKISTKSSIIIKDKRIGKNQKLIYLYRFNIYEDPCDGGYAQSVSKKIATFNRYGKILHFFGMDGLPLLFNVLKGDLSLVGPPPELPRFVRFYTADQKEVFSIRPGLWWPYKEDLTCPKKNKLSWENHYKKHKTKQKNLKTTK